MPSYTRRELRAIYDRTGGYCHLCTKKLAFTNHGRHRRKGGWDVDHSVARANGGTDHGNNLVAACTSCNRSKQAMTTRAIRSRNGFTCRPESRAQLTAAAKAAAAWGTVLLLLLVAAVIWAIVKARKQGFTMGPRLLTT